MILAFDFKNYFKKAINSVSSRLWILLAIIIVGIFLRTYNFHAWLDFGSDQVNDATRVGAVVRGSAAWPVYGPDMGNSGSGGRANRFRLGPMYYDFEIISAKIFGDSPVSMAYPDLLFSILSIPLFYYFLRKIFGVDLSLALTGLYTISFYSLSFSHSAWNVNSIPFFSLLFLTSLYEFILAKEKTHWGWVIGLGIALGVSVQLHAILLVLFPATLFFTWLFFLRKCSMIWKKMAVVTLLLLILNLGQIIGEKQNDFKNSKIFLESIMGSSAKSSDSLAIKAANDLSCTFQANAYMLSSVGQSNCDFSLSQFLGGGGHNKGFLRKVIQPVFIIKVILCLLFSLFGYGILLDDFKKGKLHERRYFFGLMLIYLVLSFFVMLPVIDSAIRYFVHLFFLPFIFLGFMVEFLIKKFGKKYFIVSIIIFSLLIFSNSNSTYLEIKENFVQTRITLGPIEAMVDYMITNSNSQKEIHLYVDSGALDYLKSLKYVAVQKNVSLLKTGDKDILPPGAVKFYLSTTNSDSTLTQINGMKYDYYKAFDRVCLFHLTN